MLHRPLKVVQPRVTPNAFLYPSNWLYPYNRPDCGTMTAEHQKTSDISDRPGLIQRDRQVRLLLTGLRACLPRRPPGTIAAHADHDVLLQEDNPTVRAAVLLPVVAGPAPTLLLTRRVNTLTRHSGQISFPGGRCEPRDRTPARTALRETWEETGIVPRFVRLAGFLDRYVTSTGFDVQPVVGVLTPGFGLTLEAHEVAEVFQVPLAFLCDPANRMRETREWQGRPRSFYVYRWEGHEIWGATAAIIADLADRIGPNAPVS